MNPKLQHEFTVGLSCAWIVFILSATNILLWVKGEPGLKGIGYMSSSFSLLASLNLVFVIQKIKQYYLEL